MIWFTLAISWYIDLMLPSTSSHVLHTPSLSSKLAISYFDESNVSRRQFRNIFLKLILDCTEFGIWNSSKGELLVLFIGCEKLVISDWSGHGYDKLNKYHDVSNQSLKLYCLFFMQPSLFLEICCPTPVPAHCNKFLKEIKNVWTMRPAGHLITSLVYSKYCALNVTHYLYWSFVRPLIMSSTIRLWAIGIAIIFNFVNTTKNIFLRGVLDLTHHQDFSIWIFVFGPLGKFVICIKH